MGSMVNPGAACHALPCHFVLQSDAAPFIAKILLFVCGRAPSLTALFVINTYPWTLFSLRMAGHFEVACTSGETTGWRTVRSTMGKPQLATRKHVMHTTDRADSSLKWLSPVHRRSDNRSQRMITQTTAVLYLLHVVCLVMRTRVRLRLASICSKAAPPGP